MLKPKAMYLRSAYQACGFGDTEMTNSDVFCGGYYVHEFIDYPHYIYTGSAEDYGDVSTVCDDHCDEILCKDEVDCNGYKYGVHCKTGNPYDYVPVDFVCDGLKYCTSGLDEQDCTVTNSTVHSCTHYKGKVGNNSVLTVPIFNFTRCPVISGTKNYNQMTYCLNYLDQTNCSDIERVGGYCEVNGYMSSVSKYMVCFEYDQRAKLQIRLCDDNFQNICTSPHPNCKIHIHRMCDGVKDCFDGSDEVNDLCATMTDKLHFTCTRRFQVKKGAYMIPVSWLMNNITDCLNGEDENSTRWKFCRGPGHFRELEALFPGESCQDVFKCRPTDTTSFVPFDQLCDGVESCKAGEENEVCRIARDFPRLDKVALENGTIQSVCNESISSCALKEFTRPWGDVFGEPKKLVYFPTSKVKCSETFGEQYLFLSCMNLCVEETATCPLKARINNGSGERKLEYDSCPGQYLNRTYTVANNSFLTFLTKPNKDYHQNFYRCDNSRCVEYRQVCDLVDDCGDMSDELECANHMICNNTVNESKHHFIALSQKCDGIYDCFDLSDECNDSCRKYILGNWALKSYCWLMGILAILLNVFTVVRLMTSIKDCATEGMLTSKVLMSLIGSGDFLIGLYLAILSIYDSIVYGKSYCENQAKWLTGTPCLVLGVISTVGSQVSLFSMTAMSCIRFHGIKSMRIPGPVDRKAVVRVISLALGIIASSLAIAVLPLAPSLEDFFVQGMYYDPAYKVFIGFPTKDKHIKVLKSYYGFNTTESIENDTFDMSWSEIGKKVDEMWDHGSLSRSPVHFYGNDGVCLFKYFVRTDDARRSRQFQGVEVSENDPVVWTMLAVNLFCFIIISLCYIAITYTTRKSIQDSGQQGNANRVKEVVAVQKKVMIIIVTDFLCWVPFIVISGLQCIDASAWYATFAMIVLPFNSVINPLVYDGELKKNIKKVSRYFSKRSNEQGATNSTRTQSSMQSQKSGKVGDLENIGMEPIGKSKVN